MDNKRQNKIIVYIIAIVIIFIYIALLFAHSIIDRGKIKDTQSTEIKYPDNTVQGEHTDNNKHPNQHPDKDDDKDHDKDDDDGDGEIVDNKDRIKVLQDGKTEWSELKELDVFNNSYFEDHSIIAPGVKGSYSFTVENISDKATIYDITYTDENIYNINMVYKLKLNGNYIAGNENTWVKREHLNTTGTKLAGKSNDVYTIEWKWEDSDNDTQIGETDGAYYKLFLKVDAKEGEGV